MDELTLTVRCESADEIRALYRALLQARQTHRSEDDRLRRMLGSGYGTDADRSMQWREQAMERMTDRLIGEVWEEMERTHVEPW